MAPCVCPEAPPDLPFVCKCDARHKLRNQKSKNSLRIKYIEIMQKFRAELAERDIDSTKIVYQQGFYTYHREFTINPLSFQTSFHPLLSSENCHHHKVINITLSPTPLSPLTMFLKRYYRWCSMSQISQSPGIFSNVAPRRKLYNTTNGQIY